MAKTNKERLQELIDRQAEIGAQIAALKARETEAERKRDARRKILIGGAILAKVKRGEWHEKQLHDLLNSELKADRDRELFDLPMLSKPDTTDGGNQP